MKFKWDKKYLHWGVTAFIVIVCSILFIYALFNPQSISNIVDKIFSVFFPFIIGLVLAFLLNPVINILDGILFKIFLRKQVLEDRANAAQYSSSDEISAIEKLPLKVQGHRYNVWIRVASIVITYVAIICLISIFINSITPQIRDSVDSIIENFDTYKENFNEWVNDVVIANIKKYPEVTDFVQDKIGDYESVFDNVTTKYILPKAKDFLSGASTTIVSVVSILINSIIGIIISVYVMMQKEKFSGQFKKIIYGMFEVKTANSFIKNLRIINNKFSGFIVGKIIDSIIIGVICFICCLIFKFEYPLLLSVVIGITNIIPCFGPIIGAIPCLILLLLVNPIHALFFLIYVIVLQQFDANILGPKLLGVSTGISSFWVLFAVIVAGGFFKFPGMIIGVPAFAVIYAAFKTYIENRLEKKQLELPSDNYINVDYIKEENNENNINYEYIQLPYAIKNDRIDKMPKDKKSSKSDKDKK